MIEVDTSADRSGVELLRLHDQQFEDIWQIVEVKNIRKDTFIHFTRLGLERLSREIRNE